MHNYAQYSFGEAANFADAYTENYMPITDFLERNAKIYPSDVALVEINPESSVTAAIQAKEGKISMILAHKTVPSCSNMLP